MNIQKYLNSLPVDIDPVLRDGLIADWVDRQTAIRAGEFSKILASIEDCPTIHKARERIRRVREDGYARAVQTAEVKRNRAIRDISRRLENAGDRITAAQLKRIARAD